MTYETLSTAFGLILAAAAPAVMAWLKSRDNGRKAMQTSDKIDHLTDLTNGRTERLLQRIAELEQTASQAAIKAEVLKDLQDSVADVKVLLVESSVQAKRILAEAATRAKEQLDLARIEAERSASRPGRRHDDPPNAQSPPHVLTPDSPEN